MPGFVFIAADGLDASAARSKIASTAREGDSLDLLLEIPHNVAVFKRAFAQYPIKRVTTPYGTAIIEGTILHETFEEVREGIERVIALVADGAQNALPQWAQKHCGDFNVVVVTTDAAVLVTDRLGRLPLYLSARSGTVVVSRESKFNAALHGPFETDRLAVSDLLLFGVPLASRTLRSGVERVPNAAYIRIDLATRKAQISTYFAWTFDDMASRPGSKRTVAELVERFERSASAQCAMADFSNRVLALSGGLDSRAVATAMTRCGLPFTATTNESPVGLAADPPIAKRIAECLDIPWKLYRLDWPRWDAIIETVRLRDGLTYIGHAASLQFAKERRNDFGAGAAAFTGDGGDKCFPDLRAPWWVRSRDQFATYRLDRSIWSTAQVAAMLGVSAAAIEGDVREYFLQYPERRTRHLDIHFTILERGMHQNFEGEERNRTFLWNQSPFYETDFFEFVMSVDPAAKSNHALYNDFQRALNPQVAAIDNARSNAAIGSRQFAISSLKAQLPLLVPPPVRKAGAAVLGRRRAAPAAFRYKGREDVYRRIVTLFDDDRVRNIFRGTDLKQMVSTCTQFQFDHLATIVLFLCIDETRNLETIP